MRLAVRIFFLLVTLLAALAIGAGVLFYKAWHGPGPLVADTTIVIDPGSHTTTIGRDLEQAGIVADWRLFVVGVKLFSNGRPLRAVKRVFGDWAYELSMSSTKSAIGHLLGAAGAVEAIFSILAIRDGVFPPTLNLENPSPSCDIDLVAKHAKERRVTYALTNSFGFGGTNASLIFTGAP